MTLAQAAQVE